MEAGGPKYNDGEPLKGIRLTNTRSHQGPHFFSIVRIQDQTLEFTMFEIQDLSGVKIIGPFPTYAAVKHYLHGTSYEVMVVPVDPSGVWSWNRRLWRWEIRLPEGTDKFLKNEDLWEMSRATMLVFADWLDDHEVLEAATFFRVYALKRDEGDWLEGMGQGFDETTAFLQPRHFRSVEVSVRLFTEWREKAEPFVKQALPKAYS